MARTVQGHRWTWQLGDQPIGSGDAGEVFAVRCLEDPDLSGVLKKPARIATGGTIQRQAEQIAREAQALQLLDGLPRGKAHPPKLLDQAADFTLGTAQYFMVSQNAPGIDMAALLTESRQTGNPFPRRVIITVLDALFDLFSRSHKNGVLWNDVKLDHIFWENNTGQITIIDWGNAQFLTEESLDDALPEKRWEDYRQMVNTLGGFLRQSAPELYNDLGWQEFIDDALDGPTISVLARRIAYQQQVIALKEMEYQALIRVVLSIEPTLSGLEKIQSYQNILLKIGAPWESEAVLAYARSLLSALIETQHIQKAIKATSMVWDLFPDSLDLSWHLLRAFFRHPDLILHALLPDLVGHVLKENWSQALWELIQIGHDSKTPDWWQSLIPVLRQKALGLVSPLPFQASLRLLDYLEAKGLQEDAEDLKSILENWRQKGLTDKKSPFEYDILTFIETPSVCPPRIKTDLKNSFAAGKTAIREVLQVWVNLDWEAFPKAIRRLAGWDPDRWGVIALAENVQAFQNWLSQLAQGPEQEEDMAIFIQTMTEVRPQVEKYLGTPPWLDSLLSMLAGLQEGQPINHYQAEISYWCAWLLAYETLDQKTPQIDANPEAIKLAQDDFWERLKSAENMESALERLNTLTPQTFSYYQKLNQCFIDILSLNCQPDEIVIPGSISEKPIHIESLQVLKTLQKWRSALKGGNLPEAATILKMAPAPEWQIWSSAFEKSLFWSETIIPHLMDLAGKLKDEIESQNHLGNESPLAISLAGLKNAQSTWQKIYQTGLHRPLIENLQEEIETARNSFVKWRRSKEKNKNNVEKLIYHSQLERIRQISARLAKLSRHIWQVRLSFIRFTSVTSPSWIQHLSEGEVLLEHLSAIETVLISSPENNQCRRWQKSYQAILNNPNAEKRRQQIINLDQDHPLYAWLLQKINQTS